MVLRKTFLPVFTVATLFVSLLGGGANANVTQEDEGEVVRQVITKADTQEWTLERMRAATPLETEDQRADGLDQRADELAYNDSAWIDPKTVGKLFFTTKNSAGEEVDSSCSASTIKGGDNNLVFTAAGCVYKWSADENGDRAWSTDMVYVPEYNDSTNPLRQMPHGMWTVQEALISPAWVEGTEREEDHTILLMDTLKGKNIVEVVGGNNLKTGVTSPLQYSEKTQVLGYPEYHDNVPNRNLRWCIGDEIHYGSGGGADYRNFYTFNCTLGYSDATVPRDRHSFDLTSPGSPWVLREGTSADPQFSIYALAPSTRVTVGGKVVGLMNGSSVTKLFAEATGKELYTVSVGEVVYIRISVEGAEEFSRIQEGGTLPPGISVHKDLVNPESGVYFLAGVAEQAGSWDFVLETLNNKNDILTKNISVLVI